MYYLANIKLGGWLSKTFQVTTDLTQAKKFTHDEAIEVCKKSKAASRLVVPVAVEDMELLA